MAALVCLGLIGALAAFVLYPRRWIFSNNVRDLVAATPEIEESEREQKLGHYLLGWAWYMAERWDENDGTMRLMTRAYGLATFLLVVLTGLWVGRILR